MVVLDSSALLAYLHNEPGADGVQPALEGAVMSAVNWSEVVQKSLRRETNVDGMLEEVNEMGLIIEPFTPLQADQPAHLWEVTRHLGLSLADRACLSLFLEQSSSVLTADRVWSRLQLGLDIQLLR